MYIATAGQGQTTPWGQNFYFNINLLSLWSFAVFSPYKSIRHQTGHCCKIGKVNVGSSFEQTKMGPSPQCYIPGHKVIGPLVLEKKIFEGFLSDMGVVAILVKRPRRCEQIFVPPSQ